MGVDFAAGPRFRKMDTYSLTAREWLESPRLNAIASYVAARHTLLQADLPDLLQEIRIALWKAGLDQPINTVWLFRTGRNKAVDMKRRKHEHDEFAVSVDPERGSDPEILHLLRARTAELPPALRRYYELRYRQGLSERSIANRLGVDRASVRWMNVKCQRFIGGGLYRKKK